MHREGDVAVSGFVAALAEQGPTRGPQNVFVNRCIEKLVRSWKFPQYEGDATDFNFPVLLSGGF